MELRGMFEGKKIELSSISAHKLCSSQSENKSLSCIIILTASQDFSKTKLISQYFYRNLLNLLRLTLPCKNLHYNNCLERSSKNNFNFRRGLSFAQNVLNSEILFDNSLS